MELSGQNIQIQNQQIEELDSKIHSLNELAAAKDDEKHHLMLQYRKLIADKEHDENSLRKALEEANNSRMELLSSEKRIGNLESQLDLLSHDCNKLRIDLNFQERQNSDLQSSLTTAERKLSHCEMDKQRLHREIQASKDLLHQIDREREGLNIRLTKLSGETERFEHNTEFHNTERETMEREILNERAKSEQLESLLQEERERRMHMVDLGNKDKLDSILTPAEAKLRYQNSEMDNRLSNYETQLSAAISNNNALKEQLKKLESRISNQESGRLC